MRTKAVNNAKMKVIYVNTHEITNNYSLNSVAISLTIHLRNFDLFYS